MRRQGVVGGVLVAHQVCLGIDGSLSPGAARLEEQEGVALDIAPASDQVGEIADAELELLAGSDAELEEVGAEQASGGVVDVGQHVGHSAPALLGGFEIGVEDVLAGIFGDEAELFACRAGLSHWRLSWP